ncbi:MAG: glycoside hydrolase family 127 protein, partial [Pirellulaceae bacterium]|nr:glycoside hydrolase family 127 protein [Pirellulaceae bacterium]
ARFRPVTLDEAAWTSGFWADRFERCRTRTLPAVEAGLLNPRNSEQLLVLLIAAGERSGPRQDKGTNWTDGDCYKWIEALARHSAVTGDPALTERMDDWIDIIARAQSPDGYLSTNYWDNPAGRLQVPYHHEMYNMGHLLTAASVHYCETGQTDFLAVARRTADFLYLQFQPRPPRLVHFPWNPSAHMGLIDLYRVTGERKYLELAGILIGNRGSSPGGGTHENGGTDQTQDRVPLRAETQAVGHAVCAMYLYCGATDLFLETGETALLEALERIWHNVTSRRMYISGGVGGKGAGESTRGDPVHEAFQGDYELPNDCYCETCANIGNAMWNWRMLQATGEARFADVMEQVLYNAGLSGVSVSQDRFFYCNPLEWHADATPSHGHQTATRWEICDCYCCPPQIARTLSSLQTWAYGIDDEAIWVHLYGGSQLHVRLPSGTVRLTQVTDYPWDGQVRITIDECPTMPFPLRLRIPGWCEGATLSVNGHAVDGVPPCGTYVAVQRAWQSGDVVELRLPMPIRLMESHPSVVANRNRAAVMRGPLLYCVEAPLAADGERIWRNGICFPEHMTVTPRFESDLLGGLTVLRAEALTEVGGRLYVENVVSKSAPLADPRSWDGVLYRPLAARPLPQPASGTIQLDLIPYYAWANRGVAFMQVWTPLAR